MFVRTVENCEEKKHINAEISRFICYDIENINCPPPDFFLIFAPTDGWEIIDF